MQKATIFTLFLSMMIIAVVADFLVTDPLGKTDVFADEKNEDAIENKALTEFTENTEDDDQDVNEPLNPSEAPDVADVTRFLQKRSFWLPSIHESDLVIVGFQDMRLTEGIFDGMIFQLLDVSNVPSLSPLRVHLTDGSNVFGILQEFEFNDTAQAVSFYTSLKQKIAAFSPQVISNETNQYADQSFFMNDRSRDNTAFLTFRLKNHVFCFSYPKASHEFFKSFILLLAKRF